MGKTALLPFRRKAFWGFFSTWKIRRFRSGLNPPNLGTKASTLPLDHRSRVIMGLLAINSVQQMSKKRVTSKKYSLSCQCAVSLHEFLITFATKCLHIKLLWLFISHKRQSSEFPTDQYSPHPTWSDRTNTGRRLKVKFYHTEGIRCWYKRSGKLGKY